MTISNLSARHRNEALRAIRNQKYERAENGIEISSMKLFVGGAFEVSINGAPWEVCPNLVTTQGMNHIFDVALSQGTASLAFYLAPFTNNVTPQLTWTAANWLATAGEFTNYNEANRVAWIEPGAAAAAIGNDASPAVFTMAAGGGTIRGMGLVTAPAKGATTGFLVSAGRLPSDKVMSEGEELRGKYTMVGSST